MLNFIFALSFIFIGFSHPVAAEPPSGSTNSNSNSSQIPQTMPVDPSVYGIIPGMKIDEVKSIHPNMASYSETGIRYTTPFPVASGYSYYTFKPNQPLSPLYKDAVVMDKARLIFDKDGILVFVNFEKNGYSSSILGSDKKLKEDAHFMLAVFKTQYGTPEINYQKMRTSLIAKYKNVYECLEAQRKLDRDFAIMKMDNKAKTSTSPDTPKTQNKLTAEEKAEQERLSGTIKDIYGIDIASKTVSDQDKKESRLYKSETDKVCMFRNRTPINRNGQNIGLAQLDIAPESDKSAVIFYELFSKDGYRRYVEALRPLMAAGRSMEL